MYTEEEAKEKFCVGSIHLEEPYLCDGSRCMGWVWTQSVYNTKGDELIYEKGMCGLVNAHDHSRV